MNNQGLPSNIPQEALPDADFMARVQRLEAEKQKDLMDNQGLSDVVMVETPIGPVPMPKQSQTPVESHSMPSQEVSKKDPEPIVLEYKFFGDCKKHLIPVSTLTAEVDGKCLAFAFCQECNKNIYSQVVPIIGDKEVEDGLPPKTPRKFTRKKVQD